MNKELRIASVSDIHLGHSRNPTADIIKNLNAQINNTAFMSSIDVLVFAGDVYDQILNLGSDAAGDSDAFIASIERRAIKHKVKIWVLRGTPSHERDQTIRFVRNAEKLEKAGVGKLDLIYADTLCVKYIEDFDIHVLFIPDEWGTGTADALDQAREAIAAAGIEQVDFAIMHGMFEYQMDYESPHAPLHDSVAYHGLVRHLIFIGHVHTFSRNGRIVAQGSFDRLAHGEEHPKGFVRAYVQPNGDYELEFIENVGAKRFVTIVCNHDEVADNLVDIERAVRNLPPGSFTRLSAPSGHAILSNMAVLRERWPSFIWSTVVKDKEEKKPVVILDHKSVYVPLQINRGNICEVMHKRLCERNYDGATVDQVMEGLALIYES